ncbi:MAG: EamA family transporter [Cyanobacteria bacterium QS_8_64_29]|nr:MAG: EamA family transporter [Cyanobacteria bacterium QS_8_64_29]
MAAVTGQLAALAAALLWAVASLAYGRLGQSASPLQLNLLKGLVAIALLGLTLLLVGQPLPATGPLPPALLALSGVLGIGIGDTAFFAALVRLGARRALLLETLAPPLAALLAWGALGEALAAAAWAGIGLTVLGVAWVISERTPAAAIAREQAKQGIGWGLLAAAAQAGGAVLSRAALAGSALSPLWGALLRLSAGTLLVAGLLGAWQWRRSGRASWPHWSPRFLGAITLTASGSTYLGIWLQQTALKLAPAGIAQTLGATSPLFVLPIAVSLGERVSGRAVLGALVAVGGIALLFGSR